MLKKDYYNNENDTLTIIFDENFSKNIYSEFNQK
jgi:hypothetical protein